MEVDQPLHPHKQAFGVLIGCDESIEEGVEDGSVGYSFLVILDFLDEVFNVTTEEL
jgi:hypothetical protein